jgi:16S rRNA (guanine1207-N2)-methyltransferase
MTEHYFTKKQTSEFKPEKIKVNVLGMELTIETSGGVFSPKQLDIGTKLLIESAIIRDGWKILDFGCGYGVVGIALKKKYPGIEITMSDVNERAVRLATMNATQNKVDATIMQSDIYANPTLDMMRFDTILLNPPQTAGKLTCIRMISDSKSHLNKGGLLQIVARHNKGGESLSKKMEEIFGNMAETGKKSGYRVYVSENK